VRAPWDPSFFRRSPLFWPIAPAASAFARFERWPEAHELACAFDGEPPVRFVPAAPLPRRGRTPASARYDALITENRTVPTRHACWHDLLNALVWASFPRAKLALHARQHRAIAAQLGEGSRLPGARTREQDAVAMLDEGGVVMLTPRSGGAPSTVIFGHAIYETLVCTGSLHLRAAAYTVGVDAVEDDPRAQVAHADEALAALLSRERAIGRPDLGSIVL
jgi:hypothetical protein